MYLFQMKLKSWLVMMNNFDFGGNKYERWRPGLVEKRNSQAKFELIIWKIMHLLGRCGNYDALNGKTNAAKYMYQDILEKKKNLWPVFARLFPYRLVSFFFQDDNAPIHYVRSTQENVARNSNNCLCRPTQSTGLDIIISKMCVLS